jgi:hypothetical protein
MYNMVMYYYVLIVLASPRIAQVDPDDGPLQRWFCHS